MIPVRIEVEGFLCYRDRAAVDLADCDLWVFSGRNGSGKSAIFDAMTYALFRAHRGGKTGAAQLIHSDADGFSVAFEFDLAGERYRLRRSLRRAGNKAERQLFRHGLGDREHWTPVPETNADAGLDRWIAANVGLTFETFTSSVLLLQGQAENLLGSPKQKHEILAGIVDLATYERLHKIADRRRASRKAEQDAAQARLRSEPEVQPAKIDAADRLAGGADAAHAESEGAWKLQVQAGEQAATWRDLEAKRDRAIASRDHAREVMDRSESIGRDWRRLSELVEVLPSLREALNRRGRIARFEREAGAHRDAMEGVVRKLDLLASLAAENRRHLDALVSEIAADEARKGDIHERVATLSVAVGRSTAARGHRELIEILEGKIAAHPDDLPARIERLEAEVQDGRDWKAALPSLASFSRDREALRACRETAVREHRTLDEVRAVLPRLEGDADAARAGLTAAEATERAARDRSTEARALRDALARRIEQFRGLRDAPACDRCGQRLTSEHFQAEATRLDEDARGLDQAVRDAGQAAREAEQALASARSALATAEADLAAARLAAQAAEHALQSAETRARDHEWNCRDHYDALDAAFQQRIAADHPGDWLATTFPEPDHLADGRKRAAAIAPAQGRLKTLIADLASVRDLRSRRDREAEALANVGLRPGDEAAEAERDALAAEFFSLEKCLEGHVLQRALAEETRDLLDGQSTTLANDRAEADKRLAVSSTEAANARDQEARARAALRPEWRDDSDRATGESIAGWDAEVAILRGKGTEAMAAELPLAQIQHAQSQALVNDIDRQIGEIPAASRLSADEASSRTAKAHDHLERAEAARRDARSAYDDLLRRKARREELAAEARSAEAGLAVAQRLAHLLGRDALQRHLLREAERGIVDRANPILGEISGGEIQLRLLDGDGDGDGDSERRALPIEALVRSHGRTKSHDVAYLSGSQKFRVAVSLALAIGQYARGKKERPIESVVIDEGFGCLDRQGRDEMIAQLKALRGRLARIILVSHQEDFAGAFDDGYHFAITDGTTLAEPFHR